MASTLFHHTGSEGFSRYVCSLVRTLFVLLVWAETGTGQKWIINRENGSNVSPSPGAFLAGRGIWTESAAKGHTKGTGQQAPRRKIGAMADHACGAGAESHGGCPIGRDVGHGAAGSSDNPRRSKRQREQEEDQGMAGEDPGMHMTCMMKIESRADV